MPDRRRTKEEINTAIYRAKYTLCDPELVKELQAERDDLLQKQKSGIRQHNPIPFVEDDNDDEYLGTWAEYEQGMD